jgi:hypothetical protein
MEVLFLFLRWVALFSHVTTDTGSRMDIPNLARVIAPNILLSTSKDPLKDESFLAINSVEMLLEAYEEFCMVKEHTHTHTHTWQLILLLTVSIFRYPKIWNPFYKTANSMRAKGICLPRTF